MEKDWMKVHTTRDKFQAELLVGMLEAEGIKAVLLNKQDSSYLVFGEAEIYTHVKEASRAMDLIKNHTT